MGRVVQITDPRGYITRFRHDRDGRVVEEIRAYGTPFAARTQFRFDAVGNRTRIIDAEDNVTRFYYDAANRLISRVDAEERETRFTFEDGLLVAIRDGAFNTTRFAHDPAGNVIREYDPYGNFTTFNFDRMSRLTSTVTPEGGVTIFTHDANSNISSISNAITSDTFATTTFVRDGLGRVISETDPMGRTTYTSYYGTFGVLNITHPDGLTSQNAFNRMGRLAQHTDRGGNVTRYYHDARGQLTRIIDAEGYHTVFNFDASMNHIRTLRGTEGDLTEMEFHIIDPLGRVANTTDPMGVTRFTHDLVGNVLSVTDRNGNATHFVHDNTGLRTSITDPLGFITTFAFDGASRLTRVIDAGGLRTEFRLDRNGNVVEQRETDGDREVSMFWVYDRDQRPVRHTDRNGNRTQINYDLMGRTTATETLDVTAYYIVREEFFYDPNGNLISHRDPRNGFSHFRYDYFGNLTRHTNQLGHNEYYVLDATF
jgi:YD repeat-containing protein